MADRYFSPREVEALIPALARIMHEAMAAHRKAAALRERLRAEQARITLAGGGVLDRAQWRADTGRIEQLTERKDLGLGLVDFPHLRDGREVNLCWKYGEREIRHWHDLDEGYAGRKPL